MSYIDQCKLFYKAILDSSPSFQAAIVRMNKVHVYSQSSAKLKRQTQLIINPFFLVQNMIYHAWLIKPMNLCTQLTLNVT